MQDCFLCEIEDFGDVEGEEGGAFYACLYFLCHVMSEFAMDYYEQGQTGGQGRGTVP